MNTKRNEEIYKLALSGMKYAEIARKYHIEPSCVGSLCARAGIKSKNSRQSKLVTKALAKEWYEMKQKGLDGTDIAKTVSYNVCTINRHIRAYEKEYTESEPCKIHPALAFFPSLHAS